MVEVSTAAPCSQQAAQDTGPLPSGTCYLSAEVLGRGVLFCWLPTHAYLSANHVVLPVGPGDGRGKQEVGCEVGLEESRKADTKAVGRLVTCHSLDKKRLETPAF